jgi:predicted CopG family antitoxin
MQVLEHPIQSNYNKEERAHYIRGFLISTKPTGRTYTDPVSGFSISKETGHEKVKSFIGKSFAIIPESLEDPSPERKKDGHFYGSSRDEIVQGYDKHAHGIIKDVIGPFYYNDGTKDYWYDFNIKLFNSQSAAALIENGEKMWVPFAVSPHIIRQEEDPHDSKEWEGLGVALVRRGAYGNNAVITKLCNGTESQCNKSMAASCNCCAKSDENITKMLTSYIQSAGSLNQSMSNIPNVTSNTTTGNPYYQEVKEVPKQEEKPIVQPPLIEEKKQITLTPEQYDELVKAKTERENMQKTIEDLQNEHKTNVLNQIFAEVKDEATRKTLFDKYFALKDVKIIKDAYNDFQAHFVPSIKERLKTELQSEMKEEAKDDKKKQSAGAGSLKPEPKATVTEVKQETKKVNKDNEIQLIHKAMFGGLL